MSMTVKRLYEFGPFVLDPGERQLRHGASRMELPPRAFDTLQVLVENSGRLLEKDALMLTVWGDTFVEENNLSQVVYLLRKALRDGEDGTRYIETVPKRGYRFTAEVRPVEAGDVRLAPEPASSPVVQGPARNSVTPGSPATTVDSQKAATPLLQNSASHRWIQGFTAALAIVAVALLLQGANWKHQFFDLDAGPIRSVAVLPLQNLSNDPTQEYFVDGMTDELITDLAQIRELKVVSKTSIMQYKGTRVPLPQIGRQLGVDAVVEGSVLRSGDKVRITAQLIRTATDHHIWASAYDGDLKDVFSLQARVAECITSQV
ncbi:MAG TPA: winged helix-turn-helix domain-containing protein, partial [Candidatus Binatia bacterium]|nr:winged helix-turn-helix domain-containing protein [Candidatus Binatia bacterium]